MKVNDSKESRDKVEKGENLLKIERPSTSFNLDSS